MPRNNARTALDRDRIAEVACALIDEEGLAGFSMRRLAKELGVEPMSLYHWFHSRDHVMDALLDRFADKVVVPTEGSWEHRLAAASRGFRAAANANPGAFGHDYFHSNPAVSSDLIMVMRYHMMPAEEYGRPLGADGKGFWFVDDKYPKSVKLPPTPPTTRPTAAAAN